jgi:HSP20 family molecular chaperone IbpA
MGLSLARLAGLCRAFIADIENSPSEHHMNRRKAIMSNFSNNWMWSEACEMLARAERMHREFFRPARASRLPAWEPPVDVLETERDVQVLMALPGVEPERVEAAIDGASSAVFACRPAATRRSGKRYRMDVW